MIMVFVIVTRGHGWTLLRKATGGHSYARPWVDSFRQGHGFDASVSGVAESDTPKTDLAQVLHLCKKPDQDTDNNNITTTTISGNNREHEHYY